MKESYTLLFLVDITVSLDTSKQIQLIIFYLLTNFIYLTFRFTRNVFEEKYFTSLYTFLKYPDYNRVIHLVNSSCTLEITVKYQNIRQYEEVVVLNETLKIQQTLIKMNNLVKRNTSQETSP